MGREFECRREVNLPATPEEVWDAVATAEGNAAWLFPNPIDPDDPTVQVWDPPNHLVTRMEQGEWFNALEFVIEGRDDATTTLRYMHSGIFVDDWDNQLDAVQQHTDFYLHNLGEYLAHFKGRRATYIGEPSFGINGPAASAAPDGFDRLLDALAVPGDADAGDEIELRPAGFAPITGIIDFRTRNFLGVRTSDDLYCFFGRNAFGAPVGMSIHSFASHVDANGIEKEWQDWLDEQLA